MAEVDNQLISPASRPRQRERGLNDETAVSLNDLEVLEATDRAIREYGFCPNRVWAIARSHYRRERVIPFLFPSEDKNLRQLFPPQKLDNLGRNYHASCTFDFCEQSEMNATNVAQRHESPSCKSHPCHYVHQGAKPLFDREHLNHAVDEGKSTAWQLNGLKLVQPGQTYMAISHVWYDGTGMGAQRPGEVNKCLYDYFGSIARQFNCDGIWWDTLCIPTAKGARAKALYNMHLNYREAEMTFVHDCFLRELDPPDYETACIAILMSPWFSRGWTALELSHSKNVKVAFKNSILDLDNDILQKPRTERHFIAARLINTLRHSSFISLDDLLQVLSSRYTSWTRDMAIIAGLLVGLTFDPAKAPTTADDDDEQYQHGIYLNVLRKIGRIGYENLYHNQPTASNGASWYPARLLSLPLCPPMIASDTISSSAYGLKVTASGNIVGRWRVVPLNFWSDNSFTLRDAHPLVAVKLRIGLKDQEHHRCLVQPSALADRVLLVKTFDSSDSVFQFVGCLQLRHSLRGVDDIPFKPENVTILNGNSGPDTALDTVTQQITTPLDTDVAAASSERYNVCESESTAENASVATSPIKQAAREPACLPTNHSDAYPPLLERPLRGYVGNEVREWSDYHRHIRHDPDHVREFVAVDYELLNAAKFGDEARVKHLLSTKGPKRAVCDVDGRTALSWAAGMGYSSIVTILCESKRAYVFSEEEGRSYAATHSERSIVDDMSKRVEILRNQLDKNGRSPLSWAAGEGQVECVQTLLRYPDVDINLADPDGWTALWYAANGCNFVAMELLIAAGASTNCSIDTENQCLLGRVSYRSPPHIVKLLINENDDKDNKLVYYQGMESAAIAGNVPIIRLFLDEGINPDAVTPVDCRTPLMWAIRNEREEVVRALLDAGTSDVNRGASSTLSGRNGNFPSKVALPLWTPLRDAIQSGAPGGFDAMLGEGLRSVEAVRRRLSIVKMLLETGKVDVNQKHRTSEKVQPYREYTRGETALHEAAKHGDNAIVEMLLGVEFIDVNIQNTEGATALFLAAEAGHAFTVELLLRTENVDVDLKVARFEEISRAFRHFTALQVAKHHKHRNVVEMFMADSQRKRHLAKRR